MNVPTNMNEEEIENVFLKYGQILKSFIAKPKPESQQKNTWACITYGTLEEAEAAIENLSKKSPHKFFIHRALSNEEKERQKKEVCGEEENGVTSFVMPQGQNDFHNANVDQTVQIDKKCLNCSMVFKNDFLLKLHFQVVKECKDQKLKKLNHVHSKDKNNCQKPAKNMKQNGKKIEK